MARRLRGGRLLVVALLIVLLATLLSVCYLFTRPTQLIVQVRDAESGAPLAGAVVEVQNVNGQKLLDFVTDAKGEGGVKRLATDVSYRLFVRAIDYMPLEKRGVVLSLHRTTRVAVALRPKPGGRLYVGADSAYVIIVDTASFRFVELAKGPPELDDWSITRVVPHPTLPYLYVSARYRNYVLDSATLKPVAELAVAGQVNDLALNQAGTRLWAVVGSGAPRIALINVESMKVQRYLELPGMQVSISSGHILTGKSAELYVVGGLTGQGFRLQIVDLVRGESHDLAAPFTPAWAALSPDENTIYLGSPFFQQMLVLTKSESGSERLVTPTPTANAANPDTRSQRGIGWRNVRAARWPYWEISQSVVIGPNISAMAIHPTGEEIYLANEQLGMLTILDGRTYELRGDLPVGRRPSVVVVDRAGERVYVGNTDSRNISVMSVGLRRIIETIEIGVKVRSLAIK